MGYYTYHTAITKKRKREREKYPCEAIQVIRVYHGLSLSRRGIREWSRRDITLSYVICANPNNHYKTLPIGEGSESGAGGARLRAWS